MNKPIAILISDIHYNIHTLPLADAAMRLAIAKANELQVPLIVAGDLHDTKANMRAECVNAMLETFALLKADCFILRGNHDQINEKSEEHSLNFLIQKGIWSQYSSQGKISRQVVDKPRLWGTSNTYLIPYHHDPVELQSYLKTLSKGSTLIMHQGVQGSLADDYIIDKSALPKEAFKDFRVISGHYHTRQDIKCGRPRQGAVGMFSYIGNPYTLGFGEANHPRKGFQILMDDGTLEFIPTNLRKHVIHECEAKSALSQMAFPINWIAPSDLVWIKVSGTKEELTLVTKKSIGDRCGIFGDFDFRLDLIPTDTTTEAPKEQLSDVALLDSLIDSLTNTTDERKERLKSLWKGL